MKPDSAAPAPSLEAASWRRRVFGAVYLLCLLALPLHQGGVYLWSFSIPVALLAAAAALYRPEDPWGRPRLDRRLYACFAAFAASAAFSRLPYRVPSELYVLGAACLGYFATVEYCRGKQHLAVRLCTLLAFGGTALSFAGLLQYADALPHGWWHKRYFLSSTYVNHNHFAGLVEILLPLTLGAAVAEKSPAKKTLLGYCAAVMASAFALSLSRGGMISLAVALIFFVSALGLLGHFRRAWWLFFVFGLVLIAALVIFGIEPIIERFNSFRQVIRKEEPFNRAWFWKGSLSLIGKYPFFGSGPGTFAEAFLKHRPLGYLGRPAHAHNDYLELLTDCGAVGFAAAFSLIGWIVWKAFRSIRRLDDPRDCGVVLGALTAFAALAIHSFLDFNFHIPANWFYAGVVAGILTSSTDPPSDIRPRWEKAHRWFRRALIGWALAGAAWFGSADFFLRAGRRALDAENWATAETLLTRSIALAPFRAEAHYARGTARTHRMKAGPEIITDFENASSLNPLEPYFAYEAIRAKLAVSKKPDPQKVSAAVERMAAMDPNDARVRYLAGKAFLSPKVNLFGQARGHLQEALRLDPKNLTVPVFSILWDRQPGPEFFGAFMASVPEGKKLFLRFLEKTGRWAHYRRAYLESQGFDPDGLDRFVKRAAAQPGGRIEAELRLSDFVSTDERKAHEANLFYRRGEVQATVRTNSDRILIKLKAKSVFVHRAFGLLVVRWDGNLVDAIYVNSDRYAEFVTSLVSPAGEHRLSLAYVNDTAPEGSGDRNVWIDSVRVVGL